MLYSAAYNSPVGVICLTTTATSLINVNFYHSGMDLSGEQPPVLRQSIEWLDRYFSGKDPGDIPPVSMSGTPFQKRVWNELLKIGYNEVITYGELARRTGSSPRSVGQAIGWNEIPIFIPCHRVVSSSGLGGFSFGGVKVKQMLLDLESGKTV